MERIDQLKAGSQPSGGLSTIAKDNGSSLGEMPGQAQNLKDREILEFLGEQN